MDYSLYNRKASPYLWCYLKLNGKTHRFSTKEVKKGKAKKFVDKRIKELMENEGKGDYTETTCKADG